MRINKYRGRRNYDEKWIYGSLLIDRNGDFHILESNIIEKDGHHIRIDSDYPMFFDNDTIGQFTGLCDKNGIEIYTDDKVIIEKEDDEEIFVVKWDDNTARFIMDSETYVLDFDNYDGTDCEVIGNIHERSEDDDK